MMQALIKLDRDFYRNRPQIVAKALLGRHLVRVIDERFITGEIVETEAYDGVDGWRMQIIKFNDDIYI